MSGSTWTWLGNTTAWAVASNWSLTQGDTGNPNNYPAPGDTALLNSGTVQPLVITGATGSLLAAALAVPRLRRAVAIAWVALALAWAAWGLDVYLPGASPHWG